MSRLVRVYTDGSLNCISVELMLVTQPFIRALRKAMFQHDNIRLHVADIVRTFPDFENICVVH